MRYKQLIPHPRIAGNDVRVLPPLVMFTSKLRVPDGDYQHRHIVARL